MINSIKKIKKKAWIIIGVSAALVLANAGVVYMDYTAIGEEEQQVSALQTQNRQADQRIGQIRNIEGRVLRERYRVNQYVKVLPDDKNITDFVQKISDFSSASGVEITKLDDSAARNRGRRQQKGAFLDIAYKLSLNGTMSQFLDFMHRFETHDRFIKVKQFTISNDQNGPSDEDTGPPRHAIELVLETYIYNPGKSGAAPVKILNADKRSLEIIESEAIADALELETYDYVPTESRRDIFADPRIKADVSAENQRILAQNLEEQEKSLEDMLARFIAIREALDKEEDITSFVKKVEFGRQINDEMAKLSVDLKKAHDQKQFRDRKLQVRFQKELYEPFVAIYSDRQSESERGLAFRELELEYENMVAAFEAGRYEEVVGSAEALASVKTASAGENLQAVFEKIDEIAFRAQARVEFAALPLELKGYVIEHKRPERAVVIINDRAYSRGEVLAEGVIVGRIDLSRVVFLYKDEEIERLLD